MDKKETPKSERIVQAESLLELSRLGARVFRNNTGMLYNKDGTPVHYGLCKGSSDIIGIYKGRFLAVEIKATGKRVKSGSNQERFLAMINERGGIAFECDDARKIEFILDTFD